MNRSPSRRLHFALAFLAAVAAVPCLVWFEKERSAEANDFHPHAKGRKPERAELPPLLPETSGFPSARREAFAPGREAPVFPEGTVEGEVVFTFADQKELHAFLKRAREAGIQTSDVLHGVNAVRIRAENLASVDAGNATVDFNYIFSTPPVPETRAPDGTEYAAFGTNAVQWLGGAEVSERWGKGVKIAILDTGVDPNTPVAARLAGVIDATGGAKSNDTGHGTAIATLLLGEEGRVTGIAPEADVLSVQVVTEDGYGDSFSLARGLIAAVDQGARVLSISLGSFGDSMVVRNAIEYVQARGAVIVAAAGNEGTNAVAFPARYDGVIAVTATDANGTVPYFGNRGMEVDVAAPGVGIITRWDAESGILFSGTSAAVPFVSGAIAGLLSREPYRTATETAQIVKDYSNDAGAPGFDSTYGAGVLTIERLASRTQSGLYNLAIADYYLDESQRTSVGVPVVISVQNRGTEPLFNILMQATVGSESSQKLIGSLDVGKTGSYTVIVPYGQKTQVTASAQSLVTGTEAQPETRVIMPVSRSP
jgi:subtilisin family serine protease